MTIAATLAGVIAIAHMAQWAAMFGGERRDDEEGSSSGGVIGTVVWPSSRPSRPC
jgi:hypothetical protein